MSKECGRCRTGVLKNLHGLSDASRRSRRMGLGRQNIESNNGAVLRWCPWRGLMVIILRVITAVVAWGVITGTVAAGEKKDIAMNTSKQTIDRLVERLGALKPVVEQIA